MRCTPYRIIALAALLLLSARPAAAVPSLFPDDTVIDIKDFMFPATSGISSEHDLPASFHAQLIFALQKAGFSVHRGGNDASAAKGEKSALLTVTPLAEADNAVTDPEAALPAQETAEAADGADSGKTAPEAPFAEPATPVPGRAATHILEGTVTLFRETVGEPNRIAGSIRIRAESQLHCTYTVKDAATGKVLIADISSGSAARVVGDAHDFDAVLENLNSRALATAAETIAAQLAGTDRPGDGNLSDRSYYQDSPGKRLTP
jgi:hypothetical protein